MKRLKNSQAYDKILNFLEKSTIPDIAYKVHQCAWFSSDPKIEHAEAIEFIVKYLAGTEVKEIIMKPITEPILEVYTDADFLAIGTDQKHKMMQAQQNLEQDLSLCLQSVRYYGYQNFKHKLY